MNTTNITESLQTCTIESNKAEGSGYRPGRVYYWAAITTGFVEITDSVTHKVTYEAGECFARRFNFTR